MMATTPLTSEDFADFFAAVNQGARPYAWQRRLAEQIIRTGRWPQVIGAPTGSGKSAVVDIHVFAVAVTLATANPTNVRVPRRLFHVVGRRALVDDVALRATSIRAHLVSALDGGDDDVLHRMATALGSLALEDDPLKVAVLRGGIPPQRGWQDDPLSCQIICATPDMLGSRLLFRGYGSSTGMRPREAGLLGYDSVLIVDEAHLNRQLLATSRRVAELADESPLTDHIDALQVVEMTATPDGAHESQAAGVSATEIRRGELESSLQRRLVRPKPVTIHTDGVWIPGTTKKEANRAADRIADLIESARSLGQTPVGVVLNRVDSVLRVREALKARYADRDETGSIAIFVGPRRRWEDFIDKEITSPDVYLATQTIEVGVDLDFGCLITDLAVGTALVQRGGRLNRTGLRAEAPIHVLCPADLNQVKDSAAAPYTVDEMRDAAVWLDRLGEAGMTPLAALEYPPPTAKPRRLALSHLDEARAVLLSHTSERFAADPDLSFWLRDSLDADADVAVVGRRLPRLSDTSDRGSAERTGAVDTEASLALLAAIPPQPHEVYPTSLRKLQALLDRLGPTSPAFVQRGAGWTLVTSDDRSTQPQPGDIVCLSHDERCAEEGVLVVDGHVTIGDVLDPRDSLCRPLPLPPNASSRTTLLVAGTPVPHLDANWQASMLEIALELAEAGRDTSIEAIYDAAIERGQETFLKSYLGLDESLRPGGSGQVRIRCGARSAAYPSQVAWLSFEVLRSSDGDDDLLSEVSPKGLVTLQDHQSAVCQRSREIGARLGLPETLVTALEQAGLHHDDGKADERFQQWLSQGISKGGPEIAKSALDVLPLRQTRFLPAGWRHEQLSAAMTYAADHEVNPLVLRLVGTSHGQGRAGFVMGSQSLLPQGAPDAVRNAAHELFDLGQWESLMAGLDRYWGIWAIAWLEAVLRSADVTVSKEGS